MWFVQYATGVLGYLDDQTIDYSKIVIMTAILSPEAAAGVATCFFNAIQRGDIITASNHFAPSATIWHNTDEITVSPEVTRKTLIGLHKAISDVKYEDRRLDTWHGGFVEQHVLTGVRRADGGKVRLPACVICVLDTEGKITSLREYFDARAQAEFGKGIKVARI